MVFLTSNQIVLTNNESSTKLFEPQIPRESYVYYENTTGGANDVYVDGDFAYVADGSSGLAVIDISDPTNPGTPVYASTTGSASGVYVDGDYAYVANSESGLAVINISDPTNPGTPVYPSTTGDARCVYVSGNYAFFADRFNGLAIIDISDPTNPGMPVYEDTTGDAGCVYVSGDYVYVADDLSGLAIIDISDPTNPGTPVYEEIAGRANGVYVSGDYAYLANSVNGLTVIDISDPTNPGTPVYEDTTGDARGVYVSGNYAYVADGNDGLAVIDISEQISPGTPFYEDTVGYARGIYVSGDYAYLGDGYNGLAVIDISDPTNPGTPVYENTTGYANDVYVDGDFAYVADSSSGLAVIDISDPTNPGTPVYADTTNVANGVYVSGDYAYIADGNDGLAVINITDPTNPGIPVFEDTTGYAWGIYVSGDYAYVADGISGLAVINISDPTNPGTPVYEYTTGEAISVYVSGDYAYVADGISGLAVINISDPTNPGTPVYENTTGEARGVYVEGDYAYVADDISGLAVIDISDSTNLGTPVYGNTYGLVRGVYVSGDYAYLGSGLTCGLAVFQVRKRIDMIDPIMANAPSDLIRELGYTGQNLVWTATDLTSGNYTIELQGSGIVAGPNAWTSDVQITYNIPDGFALGDYVYKVNFTDDYGNYIIDYVTFTVISDITDPILITHTNDILVNSDFTGQSISWTATDTNPDTYTIELQGSGIVAGPASWTSGIAISYNIPDDLAVGTYIYTITLTDDYGQSITDSVAFTVEGNLNLLEIILYGSGILLVIGAIIAIPVVRNKKKRRQKKEIGFAQVPAEIKGGVKVEESQLSREKILKKSGEVENELKSVSAQKIEGDLIPAKQLSLQFKEGIPVVPKVGIIRAPFIAKSEEISQNQELQILREFEYISGQVRFKVGVVNQSPGVLTNINIHFTIPDALKWITHEPISYKRRADSVIIPKLSLNEKKSINLYLEPISCMNGPINAIVSYFNALDEPRAITMRPKVIGITCPIFFTEEEANLARVESLYRQLSHKDKKLLPLYKDQDLQKIFSLLLKVGGSHQIKLVSKEFSAENKYGKILYYGLTKVKKQKMVISFLLRGGEQTIEVEIAGDNEEAITALLAEIENQLRVIFTDEKIIRSGDKFHGMKTSVILGYCPFCGANFDTVQQEEFIKGKSITCEFCDKVINFS